MGEDFTLEFCLLRSVERSSHVSCRSVCETAGEGECVRAQKGNGLDDVGSERREEAERETERRGG